MFNLILFGPPGSGKGTQSQKIIEQYHLVHLSTGDMLRREIAAKTPLGTEAARLMERGQLVPDEVVIGMIDSKLKENKQAGGFIFDGFPRTVPQAISLDTLLQENNTAISCMIALEVNEEELTKRLLLRGQTSGRPDDQDEVLVRKRVQEYNTKTAPVADFYAQQGKFHGVNGIGEIEAIFNETCRIIDGYLAQAK